MIYLQSGDVDGAIESLYTAEKKARVAGESAAAASAAVAACTIAWEHRGLAGIQSVLPALARRRAQLSRVISDMITWALTILADDAQVSTSTPQGTATRVALLQLLREVAEGKIYVELERARITRDLAQIRESEGNVVEAFTLMSEVSVETIGNMSSEEKASFLLEQLRLTLAQEEYVRAGIIAGKVARSSLEAAGLQAEKETYYNQLMALHAHEQDFAALAGDCAALYDTPKTQQDSSKAAATLSSAVLYTILAPLTAEELAAERGEAEPELGLALPSEVVKRAGTGSSMAGPTSTATLHTQAGAQEPERVTKLAAVKLGNAKATGSNPIAAGKADPFSRRAALQTLADSRAVSDTLPALHNLVKAFLASQLMPWPPAPAIAAALEHAPVFKQHPEWADSLRQRVMQHNLAVLSQCYTRIPMARLCELTSLSAAEAEKEIATLVTAGTLWARMDRPAGIVSFAAPAAPVQVLTEWANGISGMLKVLDATSNLIARERMVHQR